MAFIGKLGLLVAGIGAAHFVVPEAFEVRTPLTKQLMKRNRRIGRAQLLMLELFWRLPRLGYVAASTSLRRFCDCMPVLAAMLWCATIRYSYQLSTRLAYD